MINLDAINKFNSLERLNQFQFPVNADTFIDTHNPTAAKSENYLYRLPLLNVQLVIIDGTPGQHFRASQ